IQPAVPDGRFFTADQAVFAVRSLRGQAPVTDRPLFRPADGGRRGTPLRLSLSGTRHVAIAAGIALLATLGMARPEARVTPQDRNDLRLVFLVSPGPGGGGGGGGLKEPAPPPPAERHGTRALGRPGQ